MKKTSVNLFGLTLLTLGVVFASDASAQVRERKSGLKTAEEIRASEANAHRGVEAKIIDLAKEREALAKARASSESQGVKAAKERESTLQSAAEKAARSEAEVATPLDGLALTLTNDREFQDMGLQARQAVVALANRGISILGEKASDCLEKAEWIEEGAVPSKNLFAVVSLAGNARSVKEAREIVVEGVAERVGEGETREEALRDAERRVRELEGRECKILSFRGLRRAS